ncbi:UNVERIFIED_CONTAM: hypothetical protein FKN15_027067 [Acipenser sinensis]
MERRELLILLLAGLFAPASSQIRKLLFVEAEKSWSEAQSYCRERYTDLVTVDSQDEAELLFIAEHSLNDAAWIGLYCDTQNWQWSNSDDVILQVEESESNMTVKEEDAFTLGCSVSSQSSKDSRFSVSWYVISSENPERECVFSIGHDNVFGNGNCSSSEGQGPGSRLQFERTSAESYSLTIQKARLSDSGNYYCQVEEWLLDPRNAWYHLAEANSGVTVVSVLEQDNMAIGRVKFTSPRGVNLEDPKVSEAILEQIREYFSKKFPMEGVNMRWRKQDGEIFHKDVEEEDEEEEEEEKCSDP